MSVILSIQENRSQKVILASLPDRKLIDWHELYELILA